MSCFRPMVEAVSFLARLTPKREKIKLVAVFVVAMRADGIKVVVG